MARLCALLAMLIVAACGSAPSLAPSSSSPAATLASSTPSASPSVVDGDPLVTVTLRGGDCPRGTCETVTVIERSGRVHQTALETQELGTARPDILEVLTLAIDTADFDAIRSVPFTGECPVNVDGQEQIFEFHTDAGVERIASCETEVDPEHPLFAAVQAVLDNLPAG